MTDKPKEGRGQAIARSQAGVPYTWGGCVPAPGTVRLVEESAPEDPQNRELAVIYADECIIDARTQKCGRRDNLHGDCRKVWGTPDFKNVIFAKSTEAAWEALLKKADKGQP